jgi:DNA modification methylase
MSSRIVIGNSENMKELKDGSVHLVVTSPPYFNSPFDYPGLFGSYEEFLKTMRNVTKEVKRVLDSGRIVAYVVDDTLIDGKKFPVVADITRMFVEEGFRCRDRIVWMKPEGYIRISRRSGVLVQHPYPMYYYPDNCCEMILTFQKGEFDYRKISSELRESSRLDLHEFQKEKWYLSVWPITNVLPRSNRLEKGIAAFPEEIPYRLIKLYSYKGETVLDPFAGSGTTLKVAIALGRECVGYELDLELLETIKAKVGAQAGPDGTRPETEIAVRDDARKLRTQLRKNVERRMNKRDRTGEA